MAMEMYTDLRMFEEAKALAETTVQEVNDSTTTPSKREADVQEIIQRQAEWTEETKDHETAADMYLVAGQPEKSLALLVEHGPASKLIEVKLHVYRFKSITFSLRFYIGLVPVTEAILLCFRWQDG